MDTQNITTVDNQELLSEFDNTFTDEEKVLNLLHLNTSAYTRTFKTIKVEEIGFTEPIKQSREKTLHGLSESIKQLGVLEPIHVLTTEAGSEYPYILLTGFRRVYGALRNGIQEIDAIVWDFKDKDQGVDLALYLGLMLNVTQKRTWSEIWYLYQILELQANVKPSTLEHLLQLNSGDAMRLRDVMQCDYEDIKSDLLADKITLDKAFKTLTKYRKDEDLLTKEDMQGVAQDFDGVEEITKPEEETKNNVELSDDDVKQLLGMVEDSLQDTDEDIDDDDFDTLNKGRDEVQKVGERHPLDPALKSAVLARDNFRCQCCGFGGPAALGVLAVHHAMPVHTGGKDTMENLITLCLNHHILLHIAERNGGKLQMTKEDFLQYPIEEQEALKKTLKLAKVAVEADKRKHLSTDAVKKATADSIKHPMPGKGLKETQAIYEANK